MNYSTNILNENNINYDWKTLYVGLKLGLIESSDITDFAVEFLTSNPESNNQNIIQLAWGDNDIDYARILENLIKDSNVNDLFPGSDVWNFEKRKWRFGILMYFKKIYQDDFGELLNKVAEVYADMEYPEDMDSFINYLTPTDGYNPSLHSQEENTARLINLFNMFLNKEKQYLKNNIEF
ncbi:DUF2247 family protein [Bacillus swezeyi]|uniref:DUF2247 family protein n=1 Tax=Bacillus swezeyi TaxID=1925020 RepID=A0A5M8RTH0_9BACI|nr:DUF2247 family protein [Bacillus swezeyi]KAA6450396.1 DUF2247 family protein [Bacillus swezeyi]KAA6475393.1 DUF2247 family protein [Bacillus swezeyi]TYS36936.1 DUF2247 family protein [Bacillus swezeyi]